MKEINKDDSLTSEVTSDVVGRLLQEMELDAVQGAGCSFLQGRGFSNTASSHC
ncbi:hypothetical protein [Cellvibrio sp. UBA7671]|jgi:EAL domain-containing protein (putative c-di-GMP-specific phosphodiesterase class I)|uniref:hypothetical protein n=1 Tax=Cellvibrio sp. UBA7671 TaxID=1946312 RepID=UPI002F35A739